MEAKSLKTKGQLSDIGIGIATTAIVLVVLVIVLGQLMTTATTSTSSSTVASAAVGNVSLYLWNGITIVSIGMVVVAGFGLITYMVLRK